MEKTEEAAPGLKRVKRGQGRVASYWVASDPNYPVRTMRLSQLDPADIAARCRQLQSEMLIWQQRQPKAAPSFDGTMGSLLKVYRTHPKSGFQKLKPSSRKPYIFYCAKLEASLSKIRVAKVNGLDVERWHEQWRTPAEPGARERLGAAEMALNVLKAALSFGVFCGVAECKNLLEILREGAFPKPQPRTEAPDAAQVVAMRGSAHVLGMPSIAFANALQFEGSIRQWDVIGQWVPLADPRPSAVLGKGKKWLGPCWSSIDADMILSFTPTKTEDTTGARIHVDLTKCPMVLEEIALIPSERRIGPLIVAETSKLPYTTTNYPQRWRRCADHAGIPRSMWNRDLRAGGVTEGSQGGAALDDLAKQAGHASIRTTAKVYDRDTLEASRRVSDARKTFRQSQT